MAKKQKKHIDGNNEENDGSVSVDLRINMHCEGCAAKVVKSVISLDGVKLVKRGENDWKKITVIGNVDPVELCESVKGKIGKNVELISPATKKRNGGGGDQRKLQTDVLKNESAHKKFPVTTTVLKVQLHCQGCIKKIQKLVRQTDGFVEMSIDKSNDLVTVKGGINMGVLMAALKNKLGKQVEIVPPKGSGGNKGKGGGGNGKGEGKESSGGGPTVMGYNQKMEYFAGQGQYVYPQYVNRPEYTFNYMHATQMFNDENPNACVVM